jgi:hypothetical protein
VGEVVGEFGEEVGRRAGTTKGLSTSMLRSPHHQLLPCSMPEDIMVNKSIEGEHYCNMWITRSRKTSEPASEPPLE